MIERARRCLTAVGARGLHRASWLFAAVLGVGACGPGPEPPVEAELALGAAHYQGTCGVCHGRDASGLRGLGSPLVGSEFVRTRSESELVGFLVAGRGRQDAGNTTGLPMPARGGNPGLSDDDLTAIVRYLRYLDGQYLEGQHLDGQPVQLARR